MTPPTEQSRTVNVAFGCDLRYLQPLAVAVRSVVETARDPRRIHFWVATNSMDENSIAPAALAAKTAGSQFTLLRLDELERYLSDAPARGHISAAAYYRLFLPELLPEHVRKIVYLDCDVVVCRPIEDLWETNLGRHGIAAVMKPRAREFADVGLREETDYFNSGVMVLDVYRWRERHIRQAALNFVATHPGRIHGHDQPALNHVFAGHWLRLDSRWNQQFKFFFHTAAYLGLKRSELRQLREDPFIIHYTTGAKPWNSTSDHPWRSKYYEILDRTPFAGWRPAKRTPRERIVHLLWRWVPHYARPAILRNVFRPYYHAYKSNLREAFAGNRAKLTSPRRKRVGDHSEVPTPLTHE